MSGPEFHLQFPDRGLFKFPPDWAPPALAPPPADGSLFGRAPFTIDADTYTQALSYKVPLAVASIYAVTVTVLNAVNRKRGNKPWRISKTRAFYLFVLAHNIFLAVYSAVTNLAMLGALRRTTPGGLLHMLTGYLHEGSFQGGLQPAVVETVDAYCKMSGPRGLGDAATFNSTLNAWELKNAALHLGPGGAPDATDVGRLWNEGLAFWGWWFYLSKFYEVLDTAIILAKGKRSSTLQTYHHAGAMLCMWAGIRFMSPPIWMFVYINSGIHALMYTYYTLSALGVRVPQGLKRTLTSMQIAQFLIGATFAISHLFVAYTIPVSTPFTIIHKASSAVESLVSEASTAAAAASSAAMMGSGGPTWSTFKKILLRAAGEEGLAGNVADEPGNAAGGGAGSASVRGAVEAIEETKWRTEYVKVNCIDTTGQSFAIWLNVIYLMPLTMLFTRFFFHSYIKRSNKPTSSSKQKTLPTAVAAAADAKKQTRTYIEGFGQTIEEAEWARMPEQLQKDLKRLQYLIDDHNAPELLLKLAVKDVEAGVATCSRAARRAARRALAYLQQRAADMGVVAAASDEDVAVEDGTSVSGDGDSGDEMEGVEMNGGANGSGFANGNGIANGNGNGVHHANGAPASYADMVKH
ncbi:putative fatty acid elongase [Phyllosticta capitalensis]|uniref:Elongation of fatty acids protein n=1 Tax=Phyllosticta capitalensis TaxID=121624 RepID=A0ABR1YLX4_9PEZI